MDAILCEETSVRKLFDISCFEPEQQPCAHIH